MRVGIMQPYFFPYAGYFDLIAKTDRWIVFDIVKYQPKSWMNRNRILDPNAGAQYVSMPVDRKSGKLLSEVTVSGFERAADKVLRQIDIYRGIAPNHAAVRSLVEGAFSAFDGGLLRDLNISCLDAVCARLGIPFRYEICSEMNLDLDSVTHPGGWALEIADRIGADAYLNPPGGVDIFRPAEWEARDIALAFTTMPDLTYDVGGKFRFLPNASILDVMMWLKPEEIRTHLDACPAVAHPGATRPLARGLF